ncbi:HBL/NHE enterotoxin family protein [Streptomyces xiamenensis]|uniref:HBL/NHE enterotoxin family protein n=1 Tax=Streptomyces xiamenensis TaxID=408015 RepID=UPI003D75D36C
MSLRAVVAAGEVKQDLADYFNASVEVNTYAYNVMNTSMPDLKRPPADYADFVAKFALARSHCLSWGQGTMGQIIDFPGEIVDVDNLFEDEADDLSDALDALIKNPANEQAKDQLRESLKRMRSTIQRKAGTAEKLVATITRFRDDVKRDAADLATIADASLLDAKGDADTIRKVNREIEQLNDDIQTWRTIVTVAEIGMGVSIFIALIGITVCIIPGGVVPGGIIIGLAILGEAASIALTVIGTQHIQADNDAIQADRKEVEDLHQDIILLNVLSRQIKWLNEANEKAQSAFGKVAEIWQRLDDELKQLDADLAAVGADASSEQYQQAKNDLAHANAEWQEIVEFSGKLHAIDYKWQDESGVWHSISDNQPGADSGKKELLPASASAS